VVRPSAAKTPHREAERARRGAIHRPPAQIPRAKPKKISATIQNGAFFSSLLKRRAGFPITNVADANLVAGNSGDWRTLCLDALLSASFWKSVTE
jgi:hypothetical protein